MIKCPTCSTRVEQAARYCPDCYTVFPSGTGNNRGAYGAVAGTNNTWKLPGLFVLAVAVAWFAQINTEGSSDGLVQSASAGVKRWIAGSTDAPPSEEATSWSLDNDHRLPCARRTSCQVVIRFGSGESAIYMIERPLLGAAHLTAMEPHGTFLLRASSKAQLVISEQDGGTKLLPIAREPNSEGWSVAGKAQLSR